MTMKDFISCLPNEILIKIIEICVEEGQDFLEKDVISREYPSESPESDPTRSPWIMSQVCLRWRNLTLSLPYIWTFINLNPRRSDEGWNGLHSQTALQLERCQDQLLAVFWNGWILPDNDNQALGLTCAKSAQWRRADLIGFFSGFFDFSAHEMTFPELISLRLHLDNDIGGVEPQIIPDSLMNARKLHEITFSGDCAGLRLLSALPWAQITHFTAEHLEENPNWWDTFDNCALYGTLPLLTNVQYCSLEVYKELASFEGQPIVLHLETCLGSVVEAHLHSTT
ncbi:hypothetical protein PM082_014675 [Marasmius tenuissimus]|nr:hypothetical protein PM082_014675 [Marasmius tenuissimus]